MKDFGPVRAPARRHAPVRDSLTRVQLHRAGDIDQSSSSLRGTVCAAAQQRRRHVAVGADDFAAANGADRASPRECVRTVRKKRRAGRAEAELAAEGQPSPSPSRWKSRVLSCSAPEDRSPPSFLARPPRSLPAALPAIVLDAGFSSSLAFGTTADRFRRNGSGNAPLEFVGGGRAAAPAWRALPRGCRPSSEARAASPPA